MINVFVIYSTCVGTVYLNKKFDFSIDDLRATSSVTYAQGDVVPTVDTHEGLVQIIQCKSQNAFDCHSLELVLCEIWRNCESLNADTSLNTDYWSALCQYF